MVSLLIKFMNPCEAIELICIGIKPGLMMNLKYSPQVHGHPAETGCIHPRALRCKCKRLTYFCVSVCSREFSY